MKLSVKTEYALLAIIDMAQQYNDGYIRISDICERQDIPKKFLEQILLILRNAGFIESKRGLEGGYRLAKKPSEITLSQIIRLLDGALAAVGSVSTYFYRKTPIEKNENLLKVFKEIRDYISEKMETTTLESLL